MKKLLAILLAFTLLMSAFTAFSAASFAEDGDDPVISYGKRAIMHGKTSSGATDYVTQPIMAVTDGETADNWVYGAFGEIYVQIDLQFVCRVTSVNVQAYAPYNHAFSVLLSTDGETFTQVSGVEKTAMTADGVTASFEGADARYVRVVADFYVTSGQFSFREVTVRGIEPAHADDPVISLGKTGTLYTKNAKTDASYLTKTVAGLTDGRMNDNWAYGEFGEMYAEIDLETVYQVSSVTFVGYAGTKNAWSVAVSTDGEEYTTVGGVSKINHTASGVTTYFEPTEARYVRVIAEFYATAQQISYREVTVCGSIPAVPLELYTGAVTATLPDGSTTDALADGATDDPLNVAGANGGYVTVDLGAVLPVDAVRVYAYENNSAFTVYASADGGAWTAIGYKALNSVSNTSNGWEYAVSASGSFRYVRVQWAASERPDGYLTIKEIDVLYGGEEYTDVTLANVNVVYVNNNSDDGNYGNYTFYKKATGQILLDLGAVKDVRRVAVVTPTPGYGILAECSEDGTTFRALGHVLLNDGYTEGEGYIFTADYSNTRYLRFTCTASATGTFDLSEILVYTPHEHVYGDWTVTEEATDSAAGVQSRVCSCGDVLETRSYVLPGYYFVGGVNDWALTPGYRFSESDGIFSIKGVALPASAEFKAVYTGDGVSKDVWYPESANMSVNDAGTYNAYLDPTALSPLTVALARTYYFAGTPNGWDPAGTALEDPDGDGIYTAPAITFAAGDGFKITDGTWGWSTPSDNWIVNTAGDYTVAYNEKNGEIHVWGDYTVTTPATFEHDGVKTRSCLGCDGVDSAAIPKATLGAHTGIVTGEKSGKKTATFVGSIKGEELDFASLDYIELTLCFIQGENTVNEKTVKIRNIYTTLTGIASVNATAVSQGIEFVENADYVFGVTVNGIPEGEYTLTITEKAILGENTQAVFTEEYNFNV